MMEENGFFELTSDERHIVEKCSMITPDDFDKTHTVVYTEQCNFTVCSIFGRYNTFQTGVAKRRPDDDNSEDARHNISFMRAVKSIPTTFR